MGWDLVFILKNVHPFQNVNLEKLLNHYKLNYFNDSYEN